MGVRLDRGARARASWGRVCVPLCVGLGCDWLLVIGDVMCVYPLVRTSAWARRQSSSVVAVVGANVGDRGVDARDGDGGDDDDDDDDDDDECEHWGRGVA